MTEVSREKKEYGILSIDLKKRVEWDTASKLAYYPQDTSISRLTRNSIFALQPHFPEMVISDDEYHKPVYNVLKVPEIGKGKMKLNGLSLTKVVDVFGKFFSHEIEVPKMYVNQKVVFKDHRLEEGSTFYISKKLIKATKFSDVTLKERFKERLVLPYVELEVYPDNEERKEILREPFDDLLKRISLDGFDPRKLKD